MSNYSTGHDAEKLAAGYLKDKGYDVQELNWKTPLCEIDIVASKNRTVYLVEVKYRRNSKQGFGNEYVTSKKLRQMRFAAEMWVQQHGWRGDYQLAAISIDGDVISYFDLADA